MISTTKTTTTMNWYLAKIVFKIICGNGNHAAQFDEQLRLVNANTKMLALQKAIELGKSEEDMFLNIHQQPVHWQFVNVSELYKMEELFVQNGRVIRRCRVILNH